MQDWKQVEIPKRMEKLPKDTNGIPIPYSTYIEKNGKPNFSVIARSKVQNCIQNKICSICGQSLETNIWLIAGAMVALNPRGAYIDPPIHIECGRYALKVCPYLALPFFSKKKANEVVPGDPNVKISAGKPKVFALVCTVGYDYVHTPAGSSVIVPFKPLLAIEYWVHGSKITEPEAKALMV